MNNKIIRVLNLLKKLVFLTILIILLILPIKVNSAINENMFPDLNGDGKVDVNDIQILISVFGTEDCNNIADINNDCKVNLFDLNIVAKHFGEVLSPTPTSNSDLNVTITSILNSQGGRLDWYKGGNVLLIDRVGADSYYDIWLVSKEGVSIKCITCDNPLLPSKNMGNPAFHPSGNYIVFQAQNPAFVTNPERYAEPGVGINNNIWIMKSDGTKAWQITNVSQYKGVLHPHFSEDGKKLIWSEIQTPGTILGGQWVIKLADVSFNSAGDPILSNVVSMTPGGQEFYETHGFSPDGKTIIFSGIPPGKYYFDMEIYTFNLETSSLNKLTENTDWDEHAHISPDGNKIVWMSSTGYPNNNQTSSLKAEYWIMNFDGSDKRKLTGFNDPSAPEYDFRNIVAGDMSWSPTNSSFAGYLLVGGSPNDGNEKVVRIDLE